MFRTTVKLCVSILAFIMLVAPISFAKSDIPLSARECKILLKPGNFADRTQGMKAFWELVKQTAKEQNLEVKDLDGAFNLESARIIRFFDTPKLELYKLSLILRQRQDAEIKKSGRVESDGKKFELVLKYRHPDPLVAVVQDCHPGSGYEGKISFEEDVVAKASSIDHLFSLSGKIVDVKKVGNRLKDWCEFYPGLKNLKLDKDLEIKQVNGITVTEFVVEPGKIDFGKGIKAKVSMAVWYRDGQSKPLIAEFSYKYKLEPGDSLNSTIYRSARESDAFLKVLQGKAKDWIAVGQTKTGLIYNVSTSNQE